METISWVNVLSGTIDDEPFNSEIPVFFKHNKQLQNLPELQSDFLKLYNFLLAFVFVKKRSR